MSDAEWNTVRPVQALAEVFQKEFRYWTQSSRLWRACFLAYDEYVNFLRAWHQAQDRYAQQGFKQAHWNVLQQGSTKADDLKKVVAKNLDVLGRRADEARRYRRTTASERENELMRVWEEAHPQLPRQRAWAELRNVYGERR